MMALIGLNHKSAVLDLRERFAFDEERQLQILKDTSGFVDEIVLICTCNRTEFIYHASNGNHDKLSHYIQHLGELSNDEYNDHFYTRKNGEVLHHLCRVASGLDSLVPGETQILGQCKDAFERSFELNFASNRCHELYQRILHTAKYVRRETDLGRGAVSVSSVAVQLARSIFENLNSKSVLLIGAGEMCELAGEHFQANGVKRIAVVNRSMANGKILADKLNSMAYEFNELEEQLTKADIILTSTAAEAPIITRELVRKVMRKRSENPMFFIDIAVPRDVNARVNELQNVFVYNIDDLQKLCNKNLKARHKEAVLAEDLVNQKVKEFEQDSVDVGPLIVSLKQRARLIKEQELDKLYRQHPDLSEDEKKRFERTIDLIINKLLHDPIISLRRGMNDESDPFESRTLTSLFKDFFNL